MRACILFASPRKNGNTFNLLKPFMDTLEEKNIKTHFIDLYNKEIKPCIVCRSCQKEWDKVNCSIKDDALEIFDIILKSDLIVLASPVYSWYCTPPMKALLDRLVYVMNKFYGDKKGPSLWENKNLCIITTCGYKIEKGADLFEEGIKRYCKHSGLKYLGMLAKRHLGYDTIFMDSKKEKDSINFAREIIKNIRKEN